jgi:hypothetical protein
MKRMFGFFGLVAFPEMEAKEQANRSTESKRRNRVIGL